ncbi:MAG: STM3941 family protein [Bacteroidota bacterium]
MNLSTNQESLTFRPTPWKIVGLLAICAAFVAVGVFMALGDELFMGWAIIVLFGIGGLALASLLLPEANHLRLTPEGFEIKSYFRKDFIRWEEVYGFQVVYITANKMIVFDYTEAYTRQKNARKVAKLIGGSEGAISNHYRIKTEKLAEILNEWKDRYG